MFLVEHPDTDPSWPTYDDQFAVPNPCGVGCARLATLAFAPPPPQGLGGSRGKANYRKNLTPAIPRPHLPLSTLRCAPCGPPRMTRGQDDWLHLSCMTLSFTTSGQLSGASKRPANPIFSRRRPVPGWGGHRRSGGAFLGDRLKLFQAFENRASSCHQGVPTYRPHARGT